MIKNDISKKLNIQLSNTSWSVVRAANLEVFPRLMGALYEQGELCSKCNSLYDRGMVYVEDILPVVKGPVDVQKQFESLVEDAFDHLKKKHKVEPKGKRLSTIVFVSMLGGLGIGVTISHLFKGNTIGAGAIGWLIGIIAGWVYGKIKERQLKKMKRLF